MNSNHKQSQIHEPMTYSAPIGATTSIKAIHTTETEISAKSSTKLPPLSKVKLQEGIDVKEHMKTTLGGLNIAKKNV